MRVGATPLPELYVEFDGSQLTIRTNAADVHDFFLRTYEHMLVASPVAPVGTLEVARTKRGYRILNAEEAPRRFERLESMVPQFREEVRLKFIRSRSDLLWLHAGAVERDGRAMLLSGPSAQGKSTLTTLLCERGWRLMSDDFAPIQSGSDFVLPFPQSPTRRIYPGRQVEPSEMGSLEREAVRVAPERLRREAAPIGRIVFVAFCNGAESLVERLSPGNAALELLRNSSNFDDDKAEASHRAAGIARTVPAYSLKYGNPTDAVDRLDLL